MNAGRLALDLQTVTLMLAVGHLCLGLVLMLPRVSVERRRVLRVWALAQGIKGLGTLAVALRGSIPPELSFYVANSLVFLALTLEWLVFRRYATGQWHGRRAAAAWLLLTALYLGDATLHGGPPGPYAMHIFSLGAFVLSGAAGMALWRAPRRLSPIQVMVVATSLMLSLSALLRAAGLLAAGSHGIFDGPWTNQLFFLMAFLHLFLTGFGFLLLVKEDLDQDLWRLTVTDGLTGLGNRHAFMQTAGEVLAQCRRDGRPVALMMADLDHFKQINDSHGHAAGDRVLAQLGRTLREQTRRSDLCARLGGEEFAVLLPGATLDDAEKLAEQLRRKVDMRQVHFEGRPIPVSLSIGVTQLLPGERLEPALHRADQALYAAKHQGRNRVVSVDARPLSTAA